MSALLALLSRDHLAAQDLNALYIQHHARPDFNSDLIAALDHLDADIAHRAMSLLLKVARSSSLSAHDFIRIADRLDASDHWIYRLTACQLLSAAPCPPELRDQIFPFLHRSFSDRRVIIRAWALTAMLPFRHDPRFRPNVAAALRLARRDPTKSMQARLRQLGVSAPIQRSGSRHSRPKQQNETSSEILAQIHLASGASHRRKNHERKLSLRIMPLQTTGHLGLRRRTRRPRT